MIDTIYPQKEYHMLKLSRLVQHPYNVKVDYYTPLSIEVTNIPPYSDKNYFRLVKSENLLEIGLDATSYQLTNIILVQASNVSLVEKLSLKNVEMKQGCPIFLDDISFNSALHDLDQSFEVSLSKDKLKIQLIDLEEEFYLVNGRVYLGFSQDERLVTIILLDLNDEEYEDLKDSFKL